MTSQPGLFESEPMMRTIETAVCIALCLPGVFCRAATDPECLRHLGGAFGDVECFNGLSGDLEQENRVLAKELASTIPRRNRNEGLLERYRRHQAESRKFCELSRESLTNWRRGDKTVNPRYHDYDVAYYQCVYELLKQENGFLKTLLGNAGQP